MFDFMDMLGNHDERKVDRNKINNAIIDTCAVTDSDEPYETAVCHKNYNDNQWVIVEMYNSKEEAIKGHQKWIKLFEKELPLYLEDVSTASIKKKFRIENTKYLKGQHKNDE
jgi:hypothetical protein